jgi:hypothetical protein
VEDQGFETGDWRSRLQWRLQEDHERLTLRRRRKRRGGREKRRMRRRGRRRGGGEYWRAILCPEFACGNAKHECFGFGLEDSGRAVNT